MSSATPDQPLKLLLVTKRHFMTKDVVLEAYGRWYELAVHLANAGWDIKGYCLNYRSKWRSETIRSGGVEWHSYSAPLLWLKWRMDIGRTLRAWEPHVVLGCSDPLHISAAHRASRGSSVRFAVDLHDNLDSKGMTGLPGFRRSVEKAVKDAGLISCVSEPLQEKVKDQFSPSGKVIVLESAVPEIFDRESRPDRGASRGRYGFGEDEQVIGVAGALYRKRGIETVLAGFRLLRAENPRLILALAGPVDNDRGGFDQEGVRYLGNLEWKSIPAFLNALDVGIVPNVRPLFADYCYPQKAVELCALGVPLVAADLGVMRTLARDARQVLYQADDPEDFARAVRFQLEHRIVLNAAVHSWAQQAEKLGRSLVEMLEG